MRVIVYGVGAIGGTVAAALALAGREVVGIARGARRAAILEQGLDFRTPDGAERVEFPCVADPAEIDIRPGDAVMLAMKTAQVPGALDRLRAAGWQDGPVFCAQNGVESERLALRMFPNVHGVTVMMPAGYVAEDAVWAFSTPRHGIFDLGRYPAGEDADDHAFAAVLEAGNIAAFVGPEVMAAKHGKLLLNVTNVVQAATGEIPDRVRACLTAEAKAAFSAAGIAWREVGGADPRRDALMRQAAIPGVDHPGTSTTQSLMRGTGSVETDFLNGEIARIGRTHGVPVPANAALCRIGARLAAAGAAPGAMTSAALTAELRAAGADL